jgi:homoserine kinase type II
MRTLLESDFARLRTAVRVGHSTELDRRADAILSLTQDRLLQLRVELENAAAIRLPLQPAIRDIHHEHVLFTGDQVTGLIDFGAMRLDTPLADVARLVGSLVGDNRPARRFALDAYHELRPLSDQDRQLVDLLDTSGLVLGGLNWLRWLYLDRRKFSDMTAVFRRMDEIAARLGGRSSC